MRRLLLLRHAKSDRARPGASDHDRVLSPRGREDAPMLGAFMVRHALIPDRTIVSSAKRARETWDLVASEIAKAPPVAFDERIYEAAPQAILKVIKECEPKVHTLLIVGHNPGLQDLAALLVASGNLEARQQLNEKFPTAGLAVIDFALDDWSRLHAHAGRLDHFVSPRSLAAATD
jgi:phosphohistidine phosphatase